MPAADSLASWDGALRDTRQMRTFTRNVAMHKYAAWSTACPVVPDCYVAIGAKSS
jgi:hypothetical protein